MIYGTSPAMGCAWSPSRGYHKAAAIERRCINPPQDALSPPPNPALSSGKADCDGALLGQPLNKETT